MTEKHFTITKSWITDNKTAKGGWNSEQLASIGVKFPPPRGWISEAEGKVISLATKKRFESAKSQTKSKVHKLIKILNTMNNEEKNEAVQIILSKARDFK